MVAYQGFEPLLTNDFFLTFEREKIIASSIIGSRKGNVIILDMMNTFYKNLTFNVKRMNEYANTILITEYFMDHYGQIKWDGHEQIVDNFIHFYPGKLLVNPGKNSISIHLFEASWVANKTGIKAWLSVALRRHSNQKFVRFFYNLNHFLRGI